MALSPARWILVFVTAAAAIVAAQVATVSAKLDRLFNERSLGGASSESRVRSLAHAVVLLQQRDSIAAALKRSPRRNDFDVVILGRINAARRQRLDSAARAVWAAWAPSRARVPTVLLMSSETPTRFGEVRLYPSSYALTPPQTDGRACVLVVPLNPDPPPPGARSPWADIRDVNDALKSGGGVCAFYAKYGLPGRGAAAWLRERNYLSMRSPHARPPVDSSRLRARELARSRIRSTSSFVGARYGSELGYSALACVAGRRTACSEVWTATRVTRVRSNPSVPVGFVPIDRWWWYDFTGTAALGRYFVARLEQDLGPERFARLWASDAPFESALANVSGLSLGEHTRRMLVDDYGELASTPWPTLGEWALMFALIGSSVGLMVLAARRRQRPI